MQILAIFSDNLHNFFYRLWYICTWGSPFANGFCLHMVININTMMIALKIRLTVSYYLPIARLGNLLLSSAYGKSIHIEVTQQLYGQLNKNQWDTIRLVKEE
jgi:hypothetical protein